MISKDTLESLVTSVANDYKDAKVIKLEQNYRSTQVILDAANSVIKNNETNRSSCR